LSSAGQIALAGPQGSGGRDSRNAHADCPQCALPAASGLTQKAAERGLTFHDVFRTTELRLVREIAAGFSVESIAGTAGAAIPVKVTLPTQLEESPGASTARRFLMFRGLPEGFTLSSGLQTRNVWIVAVHDLGSLTLNAPAQYRGNFTAEVLLYRGEAKAPERRTISVQIAPPEQSVPEARTNVASEQAFPDKPARPQSRSALAALQEEMELLSRGEVQLRNGNIVFARALFEELAARGSARGAFAVAQTYDPAVLQQIGAVGIQGDVEKAKIWYRKAAELGNTAPLDILSALKKDRQ